MQMWGKARPKTLDRALQMLASLLTFMLLVTRKAQNFGPGPSNARLLVDFYAPCYPEMAELSFHFSLIATDDHRWPSH
jgi:hypothetical protein